MITRITISSPQYRLQAPSGYKLVKVATPQRTIRVTHMIANGAALPSWFTSAVNLSAMRAITTNSSGEAIYADASSITTSHVLGISRAAALSGANVPVCTDGVLSDALWSWTPGPVYLGTNGQLTQTPPSSGVLVPVGIAVDSTTLNVQIHEPLILG